MGILKYSVWIIMSLNNIKDGSVLKENQLLVASAGEQLRLMEQLKQNKK